MLSVLSVLLVYVRRHKNDIYCVKLYGIKFMRPLHSSLILSVFFFFLHSDLDLCDIRKIAEDILGLIF